MIKVLIVDDETTTRNGLLKYVHWAALGAEEIRTASGGEEALRLCESWPPDIVISDIRMADLDGVTLCRKLRALLPECHIIFISGYADKENLLAAFSLSAISFVEKPIDISELEKAIAKAVELYRKKSESEEMKESLSKKRAILEDAVIRDLCNGNLTENTMDNCSSLGISENQKKYFKMVIFRCKEQVRSKREILNLIGGSLEKALKPAEWVCSLRDGNRFLVLLYSEKKDSFFREPFQNRMEVLLKRAEESGFPLFCAVGSVVSGFSDALKSLKHAEMAEQEFFFRGYGSCVFYKKAESSAIAADHAWSERYRKNLENLKNAIREFDVEKAIKLEREVYLNMQYDRIWNMARVKDVYFQLFYTIEQAEQTVCHQDAVPNGEEIWKKISAIPLLEELHEEYQEMVKMRLNRHGERCGVSDTVFQIIQRIKQDYAREDLDISVLADSVYLTPTYLSNLFKKETGYTIGQYITLIRIKMAKEFLQDKSLKLYDIAEKCGYSDQNYFARIFKREEGLTPSEYRKKRA